MKLNWGSGIAIIYSAFVVLMIGMVVYSKGLDHSLVVDNYYEEDLGYQKHIDRVKNTSSLTEDLVIEENEQEKLVLFRFPKEFQQLSGDIWFYRADDKTKDFKLKIEVNENRSVEVPVQGLAPGLWKVKVDWEGDGESFYKEETIVI